jgi:hypothetical protein
MMDYKIGFCFKEYNGEAEDEMGNEIDSDEISHECHSQCDSKGCYGPGASQCVSCLNFKLNR